VPDILIRGVDPETLKRLKARAKCHGRSLQSEARLVLEQAAGLSAVETAEVLRGWKERLAGRRMAPSTDLIRQDRER
jgi:plasmid stability protein